jgi:hypothetical protein
MEHASHWCRMIYLRHHIWSVVIHASTWYCSERLLIAHVSGTPTQHRWRLHQLMCIATWPQVHNNPPKLAQLGRNPLGSHNHNRIITESKKMICSISCTHRNIDAAKMNSRPLKFLYFEHLTRSLKWILFPSAYCAGHNWKWNQFRLKLWLLHLSSTFSIILHILKYPMSLHANWNLYSVQNNSTHQHQL